MSRQTTLVVQIQLCSAAILGSGYSIPGGEDLAVCQDEQGFPYLRGTTMKGLLRESLANLLCWKSGTDVLDEKGKDCLTALLGKEGWEGTTSPRRIHITDFVLKEPPADPASCLMFRTYTQMGSDGIVADGTLRVSNSVCSGLILRGEVTCAEEDVALLTDALEQIKWLGTMRTRGMGRVRVTCEKARQSAEQGQNISAASCIHYKVKALSPLAFTDLNTSTENSTASRRYIPGSAMRGLVADRLAEQGDEELLRVLLSDQVRFLNALPNPTQYPALPAIRGFYEDKAEKNFETVVTDGAVTPGFKRANLGVCCGLDGDIGDTLFCWGAAAGGSTRIQRSTETTKDNKIFRTHYLESGQEFEGYILLDRPELAQPITRALEGTFWIGADRHSGMGKCTMSPPESVERPLYWRYSYAPDDKVSTELYLLLLSPMTMLDQNGEPCGLDCGALAAYLQVKEVSIAFCSTSVSEYGGFNRKKAKRESAVQMYDPGSLFHLSCDTAPTLEALHALMQRGLGIRQAEGFGQVLFLSERRFKAISKKQKWEPQTKKTNSTSVQIRQARCRWIMDNSDKLEDQREGAWSASLLGDLQQQCEKALSKGNPEIVTAWLNKQEKTIEDEKERRKKLAEAEAQREKKPPKEEKAVTEPASAGQCRFIRGLLAHPVWETLAFSDESEEAEAMRRIYQDEKSDKKARLQLICDLIDYSRKEG